MKQLANLPFVRWMSRHPRLAAWIALSVGMVVLLLIEARDVGLLPGQWIALVVATVLVAGACVWIISWEDEDEPAEPLTPADKPADPASKP
jgi:protein-S-isoprenylcysteine O-methyltransferase Ste14